MNTKAKKVVVKLAARDEVSSGTTHVVLDTPKELQDFTLKFSVNEGTRTETREGGVRTKTRNGGGVTCEMSGQSLTEAAQRVVSVLPRLVQESTPEQFDETMRRATAVKDFLLMSFQEFQQVLEDSKDLRQERELARRVAELEFEQAHDDDDDDDDDSDIAGASFLDGLKSKHRANLHLAVGVLQSTKGWDDAQLMELQDMLEACDTAEELEAFGDALEEALLEDPEG